MTTASYKNRQLAILRQIALKASSLPDAGDGLWFLDDIRNNFYYASYLYAATLEPSVELPISREEAGRRASSVLLAVMRLQDQDPASGKYGHWPLGLRPTPREAKPHVLPVELMGSLMVYFYERYGSGLDQELRAAFETALEHVYRSGFYRVPMEHFHHHEAKYTAAKLIFGSRYEDSALLEDGIRSLEATLAFVRRYGMVEYGALPWFWHWVQAFTCAWELLDDTSVKQQLAELLDYLWLERARFYLNGTWVGAQSRGWPHDIPRDGNVLFDYVQFGDFRLPEAMPRTEYAGFLYYPAPEEALRVALDRSQSVEVARAIPRSAQEPESKLHSYAYVTSKYAVGGIWERVQEFDNEQHRWDMTLPLDTVAPHSVNQAYFFHPAVSADGDEAGAFDPRHQSGFSEVLLDRNVVCALYPIPDEEQGRVVGVLPLGEWKQDGQSLFGRCADVYVAVHLLQPFRLYELEDRLSIVSEGKPNGVVLEALDAATARSRGLASFDAFVAGRSASLPVFTTQGELSVTYTSTDGRKLSLQLDASGQPLPRVDGHPVDFGRYLP
ncbi:hypothetical protein SAMN02799630_03773 [Paenibacillus sp. UNCCL117]|uniref:hypothetical protein n=1 Tax=unclassified Paenibacillus TaxID=185978 RepID=UPI00088A988D|nr:MULTISPECIES: hypothetical protein [unclassified Paenibacillus]SDD48502.1 hypothetical protein SAMN04488602_10923 [Paenibacillus sp. cl123]SFW50235.1 hypothetical protein SAMN02799630_03773 [Paenibacillus sp. UNCCL117]